MSNKHKELTISLNPWYYCNLACDFCYLTPAQLNDKEKIDPEVLAQRLDEVLEAGYDITHVDLYGGEPSLLPSEYMEELKLTLHSRGVTDIVVHTNLTAVNDITLDEDYELSVSYDFTSREKHDLVFNNMLSLERQYNVLTLASRSLLDTLSPDEFVRTFNLLTNVRFIEIKPYSSNQSNQQDVSFDEFEELVYGVINHPDRQFELENERLIQTALSGERNAYSDDHLYITPQGQFAVLDFDLNDNEYFRTMSSLDEYHQWCENEKTKVNKNSYCNDCQFKGHCLSEHLREVKSLDRSCNGFHNLLVRYQNDVRKT